MVELVPSRPEYAELWQQWRAEPSATRYNPLASTSIEGLRERISKTSSDLSSLQGAKEFQFFVRHESEIVGVVGLVNISHMMMYGEIGYSFVERFHGRGIGTAAVSALVSKIFRETEMRRLMAYVADGNLASRKLLERLGFQQEGICREHFIINGVPTNEILYGLLRRDFKVGK